MKKKNTGVEESNQGHRAKMNSSDRSGLDQESTDGWTTVVSKRSKRMLRKNQGSVHFRFKGEGSQSQGFNR